MKDTRFTLLQYSLCLFGFFLFVVLVVCFYPSKVCAQGLPVEVNNNLPYGIEDFKSLYDNYMNVNFGGYDYGNSDWSSGNIIGFVSPSPPDTSFVNYNLLVPKTNGSFTISLNNVPYQSFDIYTNYFTLNLTNYISLNYRTYSDGRFEFYGFNRDGNFSENFLGNYYTPIYISNNISYNDNNYFVLPSSIEIITGSTVAPIFTGLTGADLASGVSSVPSLPSVPAYIPPSFDNSSTTSALQSLFDIIDYNLTYSINRISDLVNYLSDIIQYGFKSLIDNIQNGIRNLFDNFQSLFEPLLNNISQKIDYITEPVDQEEIQSAIEDTVIYDIFDSTTIFMEDFQEVFDIPEPDEFIIEIHLENLTFFNPRLSTYYLNLGDNFRPIRTALRIFLWCIFSFGSIFYVEKNFPGWLMGDD